MTKRTHCWICTGRSRELCGKHKRAVIELASKRNINREAAAFELRAFELDIVETRIEQRIARAAVRRAA